MEAISTNQQESDSKLLVKFFLQSREDKAQSAKQGRPIFRDVEYIDIKVPGQRLGGACRPATLADIKRFGRHYEAFKSRMEMPEEGTLLTEWPQIGRSMADELAFFNVKTVEQLADLADSKAQNVMGIQKFKQAAKEFLVLSTQNVQKKELQQALKEKDDQIARLEEKVNALIELSPKKKAKKEI